MMITTGVPEEVGNFAAPPPASLDEDPDMTQPASDSPETAVTSANRVGDTYPDQSSTKTLEMCMHRTCQKKEYAFNEYIHPRTSQNTLILKWFKI
jgi:hypothetical protein